MPGLVAILTPNYDRSIAQNITKMAESMCHEDFYKKDLFHEAPVPFVAARVHLNIVNKVPQPIYNENRTILIIMDGELHARHDPRERLRLAGHIIGSDSDAELLLHLYEEVGEAFVYDHNLNGCFLALIHDIRQGKTLIVNDCLGLYRAFYTQDNHTFVIASEIKSLLKYARVSYTPNTGKFHEYFLYDGILSDETLFKEIHRLPPASIWTYRAGAVTKRQYFDFSDLRKNTSLGKAEFDEEVNRVFRTIMPIYARGKGVGLSLTGGWDTRAELAVISNVGPALPCYTWCGPYRDSLDVRVARKLTKVLGQEHHVFRIGKDFFDDFSDYAHKTVYVSDGSAGIFVSHEIYLNAMVRAFAPIRLSGKCGTQTMSRRFFRPKPEIDERVFSGQLLFDIASMDQCTRCFEERESVINVLRWLWASGFGAIEGSQLVGRAPYLDKELVLFLFGAPDSYLLGSNVQKYIVEKNCGQLAGVPSDKGAYIRSESFGRNVRLSLLALLYKSLTTLDKAYLHFSVPHIFTRMDPFMKCTGLEKVFLGFSYLDSYRRWLKSELRHFTEGVLLDERTLSRPFFDPEFIKKMTSDHFGNRANYTKEIGKIVSFEIWHRLFVDQKPNCRGSGCGWKEASSSL